MSITLSPHRTFLAMLLFSFYFYGCTGKNAGTTFADTVSHPILDTVKKITVDPSIRITDSSYFYKGVEYKQKSILVFNKRKFLVEGDLLLDSPHYFQYKLGLLIRPAKANQVQAHEQLVVGGDSSGKRIQWPPGTTLNYSIIRPSFATEAMYNQVKNNFEAACKQWEGFCNVKFQHITQNDNAQIYSPSGNLTFIVCGYNVNGDFIAQSFFPDETQSERRVLVDPSYFSTTFDQVGVFRHEIGHIIGFHHEHIRSGAPSACPQESTDGLIPLTNYDSRSVMHYFCGGAGNIRLQFTDLDTAGAEMVYGPHQVP